MSTPETSDEPQRWARVDRATWELHDGPPSAVNPDRDRAAIRTITIYWLFTAALFAWSLGAILPSLLDIPTFAPEVLVGGFVVLCLVPILLQIRWRQLRQETGYPVTPSLYPTLCAGAWLMELSTRAFSVTSSELLQTSQEEHTGQVSNGDAHSSGRDAMSLAERASFERAQRKRRSALKQSTARIMLRLEQAAAAERLGWPGWSRHCQRKIAEHMVPYAKLHQTLTAGDDDTSTDRDESETSDSQ